MTTNYRRGADFERRVRDHLQDTYHFAYVGRIAGSHTVADLVALGYREVWLVQCKRDGRISAAERELLCDVAREAGAHAVIARTGKNGRGIVLEDANTKPEEEHGSAGRIE